MTRFLLIPALVICFIFSLPMANAASKSKPRKPCVAAIHVIKGCTACETMQKWLRDGGVKLEVTHSERGPYSLYPTVVYSDNYRDHGDRMYRQQVTIPEKLCVFSCSVGTE